MGKLVDIIFWASLIVFGIYAVAAFVVGVSALFMAHGATGLIPVISLLLFMIFGYLKGLLDITK